MRRVFGAAGLALILVAGAPRPAWAVFGGPADDTALSIKDLLPPGHPQIFTSPVSFSEQTLESFANDTSGEKPLTDAIGALRQQITDQLSGSAPIYEAQLQTQAGKIFALRKQCDAFEIDRQIAVRSAIKPDQLAVVVQRRHDRVALAEQKEALNNPGHYPASALATGDLFGDNLNSNRGLQLSSDQFARQRAIKDSFTETFRSIQAQRVASRQRIFDRVIAAGSVTATDLAPLQQQASLLKDQLDTARLTMAIQLRAVLTPAQLERSAALHTQIVALRAQEQEARRQASTENTTATP